MSRPVEKRSTIVKVVAASMAGTTVEWYDFFLYGVAAALVFPKVFFPGSDPAVGVLLSLGTFAIGFIARPVGGLDLRPLRGHPRPEETPGDQPGDDGFGHLRHRTAARVRNDRGARADPAHPVAAGPGLRSGRRVGRCGAHRLGVRRSATSRLLGQLAAGGCAARPTDRERSAGVAGTGAAGGGLPLLGVADPVPAVRCAGADRVVHPAVHRGVAGIPGRAAAGAGCRECPTYDCWSAGDGREEGDADHRGVPEIPTRGLHRHGCPFCRECLLLHLHGRRRHISDQESAGSHGVQFIRAQCGADRCRGTFRDDTDLGRVERQIRPPTGLPRRCGRRRRLGVRVHLPGGHQQFCR